MTICISAICKEKGEEHVVFAVDHMITTANGEFEHPIKKYREINKNTIGMIAGRALLMDFFMDLECYDSHYNEIKQTIEEKFKEKRQEIVQKEILDTFFVDIDFLKENLNEQIKNPITDEIYREVVQTRLKTAVLLIGFIDGKAQISEVSDVGIDEYRTIHFHAIGSGDSQALNTLLFQKHSIEDNLRTTIYDVYKAKKNAEVSQGVGKDTEIGYLNNHGIKLLSENNINALDKIYNQESSFGKKHEVIKNLNL